MDVVVFIGVAVLIAGLGTPVAMIYQARFSHAGIVHRRAVALAPEKRSESADASVRARQKLIQGKLRELGKQRSRRRDTLGSLIKQAGLQLSILAYVGMCIGAGAIGLIVLLGILKMKLMIGAAGACGIGFAIPRFILKNIIKRRQAKFTAHFADALDILVRGSRTGLPVSECLRIVGREVPDPVGFEFRMLVESQRVGMTTEQALDRALERMPTSDFQFFAVVMIVQQQTGGNLAATLENLSNVLRSRARLKDKVQALSSEAKASAMIIGSLPFCVAFMLYLMNPKYIMLLFTTHAGSIIIGAGLSWMLAGILVMRQMINFKV